MFRPTLLWLCILASAAPAPTGELALLVFGDCPSVGSFKKSNETLGVVCASVQVPVSWERPDGQTITVVVTKLPAIGSRIGNLFVNPGGPGGAASAMVANFAHGRLPLGAALRQSFDIIGIDPRGVGLSTPLRCDTDLANRAVELRVPTAEALQQYADYNRALGESCRELSGPVFGNMDTIAVAKDMEAVRVALGDEALNFFGVSYGTQLGAQYAALFPDKVRAMALDGILQHSGTAISNIFTQVTAVDQTLQAWFSFCEADAANCGDGGSQVRDTWATVIQKATAAPLRIPTCDGTAKTNCTADVSVSDILGAARGQLQVPRRYRGLVRALNLAASGNASAFQADFLSGDVYDDSATYAIQAVQCQDGHFVNAQDVAQVRDIIATLLTFTSTPGMADFWPRLITCTGYPVNITNARRALEVKGTQNPVLLVHSRYDPATSLAYAYGMLDEIQNSTLLFRDGLGHTSYFLQGEAAKYVDDYLTRLVVPPPATTVKS